MDIIMKLILFLFFNNYYIVFFVRYSALDSLLKEASEEGYGAKKDSYGNDILSSENNRWSEKGNPNHFSINNVLLILLIP